ncbi:hypothetical protein Q5762_26745 [Streptomyces sp. P9(2023)]|uniref:hypothetical protein n=1 Tax=Streptomyces sp. P9(2023) TaxID=3064394 RepID=UPI0028F41137|nr:hypothetical protein [Streptomyces sp. P9(2023)]MDT9691866.1 hypothetical protein [Streptomyces sp. P9(2023)]
MAGFAGGAGAGGVVVPGAGVVVGVPGGVVVPGGAWGAGVVPGVVRAGVPRPVPGSVPASVPVPVPLPDGDGRDVLDVVPLALADADGTPSSGTSVTDPDGATAPFGVEPAPTAA